MEHYETFCTFAWEKHLEPKLLEFLQLHRDTFKEQYSDHANYFACQLALKLESTRFATDYAECESDEDRAYVMMDAELSAYPFTIWIDDEE